jgi:hypothetical protein
VAAQCPDQQASVQACDGDSQLVELDLVGPERSCCPDVLASSSAPTHDDTQVVPVVPESVQDPGVCGNPVGRQVGDENAPAERDDYLHLVRLTPMRP